jgi:hypothetical protein
VLGEKIGEEHGKVTGRRALPGDGQMSFMKLEVSFETEVSLYGVSGMNVGTYQVYERGPGQMYAEGQGIVMTADGEGAIWNGHGVGSMGQDGTMNFAAAVAFQTTSSKLTALNGILVLVEHHADMAGNAHSTLHEWKA